MKYKNNIIFWTIAIVFFGITRLVNIHALPIFTDEAIYTFWSQVALHDPANRFISLEDGKQPLFIWVAAALQKIIADPLIATRAVSILAGLGTTIAIYFLARDLFGKGAARVAAFLYIVLPFTLLYDKLALYDSLLTFFSVTSAYLTIKFAKNPKLDIALLNGLIIGLALMTKSSANFFIYLIPFSLFVATNNQLKTKKYLFRFLGFSGLSFIIAQIMYNSLRVSPLFYIIDRKNHEFIRSIPEVISDPFSIVVPNLMIMSEWLIQYTGIPIMAAVVCTMLFGLYKKNRKILLLSAYIMLPFTATLVFNKVLYPRFMLFYFPFMIILLSYSFVKSLNLKKHRNIVWIFWTVALTIPLTKSFLLLTNPAIAPIAQSDRGQFFNSWPSGYGVSETVSFLRNKSQDKQIYVATEGTFGLLPYALQVYFYANPQVTIQGFWPVDSGNLPQQVLDMAKQKETYFLFNENQKEINNPNLKGISKYKKGVGDFYMRLYQVTTTK